MFFGRKSKTEHELKEGAKKLDKLITGVIIGGAIGSVLGATLSDKDKRERIKEKGAQFIENQKNNKKSIFNKAVSFFRRKP